MRRLLKLLNDRRGATAAEYALILAIVGGAIAVAAVALGASITTSVGRTTTNIETCGGGC
jgi:pilus assembly protein Flp/PilA